MKRLAAIAASALVGALTTAAPANASPTYTTDTTCTGYRNIVTCSYASWTIQPDGTGLIITGLRVWTPQGCGSMNNPPYDPVGAVWDRPDGTAYFAWNWGAEGSEGACSFTKSMAHYGLDTGRMSFTWNAHARIVLAYDRQVYQGWTLYPNGTSSVLINTTYDVS